MGFGVWCGLGGLWFGDGGLLLGMCMSIVLRPFRDLVSVLKERWRQLGLVWISPRIGEVSW